MKRLGVFGAAVAGSMARDAALETAPFERAAPHAAPPDGGRDYFSDAAPCLGHIPPVLVCDTQTGGRTTSSRALLVDVPSVPHQEA